MTSYKLDNNDNSIHLAIANKVQNNSSLYFIGALGLVMFLMPVLMIFSTSLKPTFGWIIVCLVAWFISAYFFRLYLWNKYGEEVFIFKDDTLETYSDYKLFRDNRKVYHSKKVNIVFFIEEEIINPNTLSKKHNFTNYQSSVIGFEIDNELIVSHKEIPIFDIIEISKSFKH